VRYGDAGDRTAAAGVAPAWQFTDIIISSFRRGTVLLKQRSDGVRVTAALPGMPAGPGRIVGDDVACGTPMTGTPPLSIYAGNPGGGLLGIVAEPTGDPSTIASIRLFKGSGTGRPAGCSGFDAVLAPLPG